MATQTSTNKIIVIIVLTHFIIYTPYNLNHVVVLLEDVLDLDVVLLLELVAFLVFFLLTTFEVFIF